MVIQDAEAVKNYLKRQARGNVVVAKVAVHYHENLVREYQRVVNSLYRTIKPDLAQMTKDLIKLQYVAEKEGVRMDSDVPPQVEKLFLKFGDELDKKIDEFGLNRKVEAVSIKAYNEAIREWKRIVEATFGVDLFADELMKKIYVEKLNVWIASNVDLIVTAPKDMLFKLKGIIWDNFKRGFRPERFVNEIQRAYDVSHSRAKFWARDQMAKLYGDITKAQQEECGVRRYKWSTSKDERVRDGHKELEGKIFDWDNPPIVDKRTGRRCHPAQDYNCRCCAIPVFDIDWLRIGEEYDTDGEQSDSRGS